MDKISSLIQQNQRLFHTSDLKTLWNIQNSNTLYQTISRLVKKNILFTVQKGFYSIVPIDKLDPIEIGFRSINSFCYLSTESVMANNGVINQSPDKITFVSNRSASFTVNNVNYLVRQMKPQCLNNTLGITQNDKGIFIADTTRAICDMLYFQPTYSIDADNIIDHKLLKNYQSQINYDNRKTQ